jgi:hypothetical protein
MKTLAHLQKYLNSSQNEKHFRQKLYKIYNSLTFFRRSCRLWANVKKIHVSYSQTSHRCQHNTAHGICILDNWGKNTDTYSEYLVFMLFHGNNGYENESQYYVTRTLPALLVPGYRLIMLRAVITDDNCFTPTVNFFLNLKNLKKIVKFVESINVSDLGWRLTIKDTCRQMAR